jgi:hypothetical protein
MMHRLFAAANCNGRRGSRGLFIGLAACVVAAVSGCRPAEDAAQASRGKAISKDEFIGQSMAAVASGTSASLDWRQCDVTDADLARLKGLTSLSELHLGEGRSRVTDQGLAALRHLRKLRVLVLGDPPLSDAALEHLAALGELERLNVVGTHFTDEGLARLAPLKKLTLLRLGSDRMTDAGLKHLAQLPALKQLILVDTPITDGCVEHIRQMPGLESLYLHGTQVTEEGEAELRKLVPHLHR